MLAEATYDMTATAFQKDTNEDDKRLFVLFNEEAVQDKAASAAEGRPIFKMQPYVMIMVPGDKDSVVHTRVEESHKRRFSKQWEAFQKGMDQSTASGTPLKMVPWLTKAQVKELEFFNCHTVEQLANIPDTHSRNFMGLQAMKQQAKAYLEAAAGEAPITRMTAELKERDDRIAHLESVVMALEADMKARKEAPQLVPSK